MNTAVNGVVQIEPFKFFHYMNESICNYQEPQSISPLYSEDDDETTQQMSSAGSKKLSQRSSKPAGIAHLGGSFCLCLYFA